MRDTFSPGGNGVFFIIDQNKLYYTRIVYYLMNIRVVPRTLYLSRHGQSSYNSLNRLGGDSDLTVAGEEYSKRLAAYINDLNIDNVFVWTSWLKRTIQTAQYIKGTQERFVEQ